MRPLVLVLALTASLGVGVGASRAAGPDTPSSQDLAAQCHQEFGSQAFRFCRGVEQLGRSTGGVCRFATGNDDLCREIDGRTMSQAALAAYEASWTPAALELQRELDDDVEFLQAFIPHTHNANNSAAYTPTLSGLDHNQQYSVGDQLRMGVRAVELDVHWQPSAEGKPEHQMRAPVVCHALEQQVTGPVWVHPGCTWERHFRHDLAEIKAFLDPDADGDADTDDVLVLYIEDHLEGDAVAADETTATINDAIGGFVYRPAASGCNTMPYTASRADIRAANKRVLIVGNCGAGSWNTWVHARGTDAAGKWREGSSGPGDDFDCAADRLARNYEELFVRTWDDSTWLSAMNSGSTAEVTLNDTREMTRCGFNFIGFDQLHPGDPRLPALVWSWAEGELPASGECAVQGADGRWQGEDCAGSHAFACHAATGWLVTTATGAWSGGDAACAAAGGDFVAPWNGWENGLVRTAAGSADVWVAYQAD
jgi:hypothetical protein